jgi:hypothetical protein
MLDKKNKTPKQQPQSGERVERKAHIKQQDNSDDQKQNRRDNNRKRTE